jgi:transcriptional regulator with XRE-family HTH domain
LVEQQTKASRVLREALEVSTLSLSDLAAELGISSSALRRYRLGNRIPPAAVARQIARALRTRAQRLEVLAARLEVLIHRNTGGAHE